MKKVGILLLLVFLSVSSLGWANGRYNAIHKTKSFTLKGGYYMLNGKSDLWEYNNELLTVSVEDFNNFAGFLELGFPVEDHFDVAIEFGIYQNSVPSEYRDFVDADGYPIEQQIDLRIIPIVFSGKFFPIGKTSRAGSRGRTEYHSVIPYVGAGIGFYIWRYEEYGDYIDFSDIDLPIYITSFTTNGADLGMCLKGGVEIPIGSSAAFMAEFSRHFIKGKLSDDFAGFEKFDLGGNLLCFGIVIHY